MTHVNVRRRHLATKDAGERLAIAAGLRDATRIGLLQLIGQIVEAIHEGRHGFQIGRSQRRPFFQLIRQLCRTGGAKGATVAGHVQTGLVINNAFVLIDIGAYDRFTKLCPAHAGIFSQLG